MKIICIGRNYVDHAKELNNPLPKTPLFFLKPETSLLLRNRPFYYPDFSTDIQYEAELVLRISKVGKNIPLSFAQTYYEEIGIGIDFTARDLQEQCKKEGHPWEIAKGFDFSAPIGTFVHKKNFNDVHNINFHLDINGKTVQQGNSKQMIFSFETIIAHISQFIMLKMGDLIFTGTPAGVGKVNVGDKLEAFIENERLLSFQVK